jgi:hypothetical protein
MKFLNKFSPFLKKFKLKNKMDLRENSMDYLVALESIEQLTQSELENLKHEILKMITSTFIQKKFNLIPEGQVLISVYDSARTEDDLTLLSQLPVGVWKKIIAEMMVTSMELSRELRGFTFQSGVNIKVGLLNVPALRRSSLKILKNS